MQGARKKQYHCTAIFAERLKFQEISTFAEVFWVKRSKKYIFNVE